MGRWAGHRNGQVEGEHPRKVHGPNPQSHRDGSPGQPSRADPTARGGYTSPRSSAAWDEEKALRMNQCPGFLWRGMHFEVTGKAEMIDGWRIVCAKRGKKWGWAC